MRVLLYFLFSLILTSILCFATIEVSRDSFGIFYFVGVLLSVVISVMIGYRLKIPVFDIAAVNSFSGFAFSFPLIKLSSGIIPTSVAFLMVSALCIASVYLFLRILGWVGANSDSH